MDFTHSLITIIILKEIYIDVYSKNIIPIVPIFPIFTYQYDVDGPTIFSKFLSNMIKLY